MAVLIAGGERLSDVECFADDQTVCDTTETVIAEKTMSGGSHCANGIIDFQAVAGSVVKDAGPHQTAFGRRFLR